MNKKIRQFQIDFDLKTDDLLLDPNESALVCFSLEKWGAGLAMTLKKITVSFPVCLKGFILLTWAFWGAILLFW